MRTGVRFSLTDDLDLTPACNSAIKVSLGKEVRLARNLWDGRRAIRTRFVEEPH